MRLQDKRRNLSRPESLQHCQSDTKEIEVSKAAISSLAFFPMNDHRRTLLPSFLARTLPYAKSFNTLLSPHFPFLYFSCLVPKRMEDEYNQPIQQEDISASWQVKTHQMWAGRVMKGKALEQLAKSSVTANSIQWLPTSTKALFYMYSILHWTECMNQSPCISISNSGFSPFFGGVPGVKTNSIKTCWQCHYWPDHCAGANIIR